MLNQKVVGLQKIKCFDMVEIREVISISQIEIAMIRKKNSDANFEI